MAGIWLWSGILLLPDFTFFVFQSIIYGVTPTPSGGIRNEIKD